MNHSCVLQDHKSFCKNLHRNSKRKPSKGNVTEYHEVAMTSQFPQKEQQVVGLHPGTVPEHMKSENINAFPTWVVNAPYGKEVLLKEYNFPAAKVNQETMLKTIDDPLLDKRTRYLDRSLFSEIGFMLAKRAIKYLVLDF
mmetsp:Transcript_97/g.263  ORF Transcript_97/g.263 Transcript_97/m.263 type:complete len:140 (-) Transcript_97:962-1381(-)